MTMREMPVLYSFRRCPYAIRARMALSYSGIAVELREVVLRDKPQAMLDVSPKGTVPVLITGGDSEVIEESRDVMDWALERNDPAQWRRPPVAGRIGDWLDANDGEFKAALDRYKYADRHPQQPAENYRARGEQLLRRLEGVLAVHPFLHGAQPGYVDVALFPFVRQFVMVDESWFRASPYTAVGRWLDGWLTHQLFQGVMQKHPPWVPGQSPLVFGPGQAS